MRVHAEGQGSKIDLKSRAVNDAAGCLQMHSNDRISMPKKFRMRQLAVLLRFSSKMTTIISNKTMKISVSSGFSKGTMKQI